MTRTWTQLTHAHKRYARSRTTPERDQASGRVCDRFIPNKDLGDNLFMFTFLQQGGKRRAIIEGPWEFGGDLLIVVDFDETKRLNELEFTTIPVWI
jgi:hypothetical protein